MKRTVTIKKLDVTVVDHDNAEQDDAVADANQAVIERLGQDFPFNNF